MHHLGSCLAAFCISNSGGRSKMQRRRKRFYQIEKKCHLRFENTAKYSLERHIEVSPFLGVDYCSALHELDNFFNSREVSSGMLIFIILQNQNFS
jgi:hypothetical protein